MNLLSKNETDGILNPYKKSLKEIILKGWQCYKDEDQGNAYRHGLITKAMLIHDYIVDFARQEFHNNPNINILNLKGLFLLVIENKIYIRFNKLDAYLRPAKSTSNQFNSFINQLDLFKLEIESKSLNLIAGYLINDSWENIKAIHVCCPLEQSNLWTIKIYDEVAQKVLDLTKPDETIEPVEIAKPKTRLKQINVIRKTGSDRHE